jgi:FAD synthase
MDLPLSFSGRHVSGSSRGRLLGTPTLNLALSDVPPELQEGIYACRISLTTIDSQESFNAVMHYGPRPVFKDTPSCEIHIIDKKIDVTPETVSVEVIAHLRPVRDFPSVNALMTQIADDIAQAKKHLQLDQLDHQ